MRIISGRYGRRKLAKVRGDIRPTGDRLRGALFDVLGESVIGSTWLDGFAGSGAIGIEALSRGARYVVFNDRDPVSLKLIRKNLELCRASAGWEVHGMDIFALLREVSLDRPIDFAFFDPPYDFGRYDKLLAKATLSPAIGPDAHIILEMQSKTALETWPDSLQLIRRLRAGSSCLRIFRRSHSSLPEPS